MTDRTDNFNRTASAVAMGTPSDGGSAWVADSGTWGIYTGGISAYKVLSDNSTQLASLESSVSNVEAQVSWGGFNNGGGLVVRVADASNHIIAFMDDGSGTYIYEVVAGVSTQIGSTYSGGHGSLIKMRCDSADLITFYIDGTARVSGTAHGGSSNTRHGIWSFRNVSNSLFFDDFSITAIAAGAAGQPTIKRFSRTPFSVGFQQG